MLFREIATFDVFHAQLTWPWIAFSADERAIAFASSPRTILTRRWGSDQLLNGHSIALPPDLVLGGDGSKGMTAFAVANGEADLLAIAGNVEADCVVAILDPSGERRRLRIVDVLGPGHELRALAFDRKGSRLWLSAENETETVTALVDVASLGLVGVVRSAPFPRPALHEIHRHAQDDAIIIVAACGENGTFANVVGYAGDEVSAVPGALDTGAVSAGFVGFSADGARVHLAEADELRTHAWPTLHELSSVPLADDFVSSFSGAVIGTEVLVDGNDADTGEDAVMAFDKSAIQGVVLPRPAPVGMWAGRLGGVAIVTVESQGDPVRARVYVRRDGALKSFAS